MGLGRHEVIAPDVITVLRPEPNARSVVQPQAASRLLSLGDFQALPAPDATDAVFANIPPSLVEEGRDPAIAIPTILRAQGDDGLRQRIFISSNRGNVALRSPRLADQPARMTFREAILLPDAPYRLPASVGRYKFPEAISLRTCFSSDRSATNRFSRAFSRSKSFIRLA
jgi:hypothetical protein